MERLSIDEIIEHCKRKVARYEQLNGIETLENVDISNNFVKEYWEHRQVIKWLQELKEYRQLKKQGLLLKLAEEYTCCPYCGQKIKFKEPPKVKMIEISIKVGGVNE